MGAHVSSRRFPGAVIPSSALTAVLVREHETELIRRGLYYRVATSLAGAYRYYPYPAWSDFDRKAVVTELMFEKSALSKVPFLSVCGLTVRASVQAEPRSPEPGVQGMDAEAEFGNEIILRITRKALPQLQAHLQDLSEGGPVALLTDPDSSANSRLFWSADSGETIALHHPSGPGRWITGGFLILGHGEGIDDRVAVVEDGFAAMLSPGSWEKLKESIASGLPVKIPAADGSSSLSVEFLPAAETTVVPTPLVETDTNQAVSFGQIFLFNPDDQLVKRGFDAEAAGAYFRDLVKAASAVLAGCQQQDAHGLLIAVGVKPGKKVRVWCEAVEGSLSQETLKKLESELEKVPTLNTRKGPVAFVLTGSLWGRDMKEFPQFPAVWIDATKGSRKAMTVPDGLFKIIWPD